MAAGKAALVLIFAYLKSKPDKKRSSYRCGAFLVCAWHAYCADGLKEALSPNQREDNQQARATLVTVLSGGSRGGVLERSASEPRLACMVGNLA